MTAPEQMERKSGPPRTPRPKPELGDRTLFPDLTARAYLSHAAIAPPSLQVRDAIENTLRRYSEQGVGAYAACAAERRALRLTLAALIGVDDDDIALTANTTRGVSDVALSVDWEKGDRILLFHGEFPTNVTPWQRAAKLHGLECVWHQLDPYADGTGDGLARLEQELKRGLRLVAVSAVQFRSGLKMPLREMAEQCHRHGAELFVDGIQACGVVDIPAREWGIDYLACGGHKWLMGPEGTGFLYVAPHSAKKLRPTAAGWLSHVEAETFLFEGKGHLSYDRPLKKSARVFESGTLNVYGFTGLRASVELIHQLGVENIFRHVTEYLRLLEAGLMLRGFQTLRTHDIGGRSAILSVETPQDVDALRLHAGLRDAGVIASIPDGTLRFSPHWPNPLVEVETVLDLLDEVLESVRR